MNELDKYTTRTFLKFSRINEENTDNAIINILNKVVLKGTGRNIDISRTDRNHRVALPSIVNPEIS